MNTTPVYEQKRITPDTYSREDCVNDIAGECTICGTDLLNNEEAYALTAGVMRKDLEGFCTSDAVPWEEVICIECMDEIDKAFLEIRERLHTLHERTTV